jgi:hypothetical protein
MNCAPTNHPEGRRTGVTLLPHSSEPKLIRNSCSKSACSERLTSDEPNLLFHFRKQQKLLSGKVFPHFEDAVY